MKDAIDLLEAARSKGLIIEDYLNQAGLFARQRYSGEAQAIAHGLRDGKVDVMLELLKKYHEHARYASEYQGPGLFGDLPDPVYPRHAFNDAFGTDLPH